MKTLKVLLIVILVIITALFAATNVSRRISGVEEPPVISCSSDTLEVSITASNGELLQGITAKDPQDGDLTAHVQIAGISKFIGDKTAKVTYVVFDSDHNMDSLSRYVRYTDYVSPKFFIKEPLIFYRNESVDVMPRLQVLDVVDGDISDRVRISSLQSTDDPELFYASAQVTNSMGDLVSVVLPVIQVRSVALIPEVQLTSYLVHLSQGTSFNPRDYVLRVETPDGNGNTDRIQISGSVDTKVPGTYYIRYEYIHDTQVGTTILTVVVQ